MRFRSTGNRKDIVSAADVLEFPIPELGHLWMPVEVREIEWPGSKEKNAGVFISRVVQHFFDTRIHPNVFQPIDLRPHEGGRIHALNLHRGPTKSFKDVGCAAAAHIQQKGKVVVATSGDTGSAAAHAFGPRALVLYPASRISAFQERQMLSSDAAVCAVEGDFDDCQRIAKRGGKVAREGRGGAHRRCDKVRGRRKIFQPFLCLSAARSHVGQKNANETSIRDVVLNLLFTICKKKQRGMWLRWWQ